MPHYLAIGLSKREFFHSTPKVLQAYDKAHELRTREQDYMNYLMGRYNYEAVAVAIGNAFRKKGTKPEKYRELSYLEEERRRSGNLTEQEKIAEIDKLFGSLEMMQKNWEMHHKNEDIIDGKSS